MKILFICTGNTCRSPMAEAIYNNLSTEQATAKSAGLFAMTGSKAAENTMRVLEENKLTLNHRAKQVMVKDVQWATYIITMTESHKTQLVDQFPETVDKVYTLKEYAEIDEGGLDVLDPYGGNVDVYRQTFLELKELIKRLPGVNS